MRNARMVICLAVVMFIVMTGQGFAEMYLQDGGTYNITTEISVPVYVDMVMPENPTTVNILEGANLSSWPVSIQINNNANINVYGGDIGCLYANDNSNVNISGGYAYGLYAYDTSTATVSPSGYVSDICAYNTSTIAVSSNRGIAYLYTYNDSSVTVSSDGVVSHLYAYDNSTVAVSSVRSLYTSGNSNVYVTTVCGEEIEAIDNSTINISSGDYIDNWGFNTINTRNTSTINISGGYYPNIDICSYDTSTMNLTGGSIDSPSDRHGGVGASGESTLNISEVSINGYLSSSDSSTVNIYSGSFYPADHSWIGPEFPFCGGVSASGTSTMNIFGGYIDRLVTYGDSTVNVSGGRIGGKESFHIFGGLYVSDNSNVNIIDGYVDRLFINDNGSTNVSGGSISELYALDFSSIIFDGYDFDLGVGLLWDVDGGTILGTGILTGKWFDGTSWTTEIYEHDATATIIIIPEPATISLFVFGGLLLRRKK